jgi:hypothetical protein
MMAFTQTCRHFSLRSLTLLLELMGTELIEMFMALSVGSTTSPS